MTLTPLSVLEHNAIAAHVVSVMGISFHSCGRRQEFVTHCGCVSGRFCQAGQQQVR